MSQQTLFPQKMRSALPGAQFELDFATWLREEKGYDQTEVRHLAQADEESWPYEVDVHAIRFSRRSRRLQLGGAYAMLLASATYFFDLTELAASMNSMAALIDPSFAGSGVFLVGLIGFLVGMYGKKRQALHAWIECKDWKSKVSRPVVEKLVGRSSLLQRAEEDTIMLATRTGFSRPALEAARGAGVECFVQSSDGFRRVD